MARKAREKSSTGIYAVILRGYDRIFRTKKLRDVFSDAADKYLGEELMGIRFFDDHVHMLVRESEKGISLDMKPLITSFARSYNKETGNDGKVFADRFKSVPVETAELEAQCIAYLNSAAKTAPFESGAASEAAVKKTAPQKKKNSEPKKPAAKKTVAPKPEPKPEPPKPKKKKALPSWLL